MEPLSIALSIAKLTGADDWLLEKVKGNKTAAKLLEMVAGVTGDDNPKRNLALVKESPELQSKIRMLILSNKHELQMAAYQDRADARSTYKQHPEQADKIAERIMRWNLPYIALLLLVNCVAIYFFKEHGALLAAISNVLGMAIKSLFDERKEVSGFYFGGSMQTPSEAKSNEDTHHG